jgi:hypothetical protein
MERITGPFNGFYIATYAAQAGDAGRSFLAYAKICRGKPDNYWDAHCCAKISTERAHDNAHDALHEAELRARGETQNLVHFAIAKPPVNERRVDIPT